MDPAVSILLEHIKEQTGYMKQHTHLLTSINEQLAKLNASNNLQKNKLEDEDDMKKGKGEQRVPKKEEEHDESPNEEEELVESPKKEQSPAPEYSSSSAYYRLEIEGVVGVEDQTQGTPDSHTKGKPASTSHTLTSKSPLNIRVNLKKDGEQVKKDDKLANVKVQLVVLNDEFYIDDKHNPSWPLKDFTARCLHLNENNPTKKLMVVDKCEFRLSEGSGAPHKDAAIKLNSNKKLVKLGVMIHPDDYHELGATRVLEGVSNSFLVKDPPRAKKGKTDKVLGKRPMNVDNESSPRPGLNLLKWRNAFGSSVEAADPNECPAMPSRLEYTEHQFTANQQPSEGLLQAPSTVGNFSLTPPTTNCTAGAHHVPRPHNLMMGCVPNVINDDDIQKIISDLSAARDKFEQGIWAAQNASLIQNLKQLAEQLFIWTLQECPTRDDATELVETIELVVADIDSVPQTEVVVTLKSHLNILKFKFMGASSSVVTQQGDYGAPGGPSYDAQGSVVPATDFNIMDQQQNTDPSGQRIWAAPNAFLIIRNLEVLQVRLQGFRWFEQDGSSTLDDATELVATIQLLVDNIDHVRQTEDQQQNTDPSGQSGFGGQQYGTRPSFALTPLSGWTSGLSPTYLGQTNGSNRNFLDQQQYSEGYSVPSEYNNAYAYAAGGEQIENTYGPYGYGNEGGMLVRNSSTTPDLDILSVQKPPSLPDF